MSYTPQADSLAGRVCAFFRTHPDEELEGRDIATKFGVNSSSVSALLASAMAASVITRGKDSEGTVIFKAGPNLFAKAEAPAAAPQQPAAAPTSGFKTWLAQKEGGGSAPAPALPAPDSLVVEPGVPMPGPPSRLSAFAPVFARMQTGDSFAVVTPVAKKLISAASRFGKPLKRKFVMRQVDETKSRIWRTE